MRYEYKFFNCINVQSIEHVIPKELIGGWRIHSILPERTNHSTSINVNDIAHSFESGSNELNTVCIILEKKSPIEQLRDAKEGEDK
jgi:hypothetical protein